MNPTSTNVSSPSTSTQSRLPTSFSPFRNQFSQSAQSCSDSDLESTRKDSQNSQDSTHFSQTLPSQVQMYYPNSFPSNSANKQDFGLFSEDNTLPIAYNCSRKKIQSLNEIESKDDLTARMINRQREILLNNRASTSTALQPIAEKAETPRNDGSDITESSSPQSTRQDLQYLQDNDLLKKYDESERESQGKLSCTTTPLSAKSMFPTSFFGSSNPIVPLQNFNSSSCINLSTNLAKPDSNKPNLPPLSVPSKMNGTTTASRDLFAEFNNEKSDEDNTPQNFKMMQNKFLPKRTVSDNNIPTHFNQKDELAKSAQKILNTSSQKVFDFGQNIRTTQHCYSALLKPKSQYANYGDDDDEDDEEPGFIARLKNNLLPVKSNPNPDAFRPTKALTDFPQASTFGSQPEHNTSFGSHFQAPLKIFGTLGGCTSALLGPKTATKLFDSDDEEEEMKTTSITNFKSVPLNSRAATENIHPRLGNKLPHIGTFAVAPSDLNTSHNASKVLDFDDDDHDLTVKSQCASALIKSKEAKTLFSEFGQEEQELKNKAAKPSKSPFAIGRSNSENAIPFGFNKAPFPQPQAQNTSTVGKLLLDPSTPVASNTAHNESVHTHNIFSENNPLLAQLRAEKITSTPHSADHQFSSDPSKNDFKTHQASQFGPNALKMQRSATTVCLPQNSAFFQRSGSVKYEFYLEPTSRFDSDYVIVDVLGEGTFMRVLLCEHVLDKQLYVVKCSHERFNALDDEENITQTLNKVQAMTSGNSEDPNHHVVRYYNSWKEDGNLYVVMEYCEGGNLTKLNLGGADKSESEIRKILLDICTALRPLHKKKAVHLHIKPENILLSKAGKYKLGDFGLSNLDYQAKLGNLEGDTVDKDLENAMYYFGPELLDDEHCGVRTLDLTKADIYSFGLCLAEFVLGVNFRENKEIMDELKEGDFSKLQGLKDYSEELKETIESMLSQQPENRPSAEYILQQYARNDAQEIQQEKQENKKLRATVDHLKKQLGLKRKKSL